MSDDRLTPIIARKREEIARLNERERELRQRAAESSPARPWASALRRAGEVSLIAEMKRRAPSAGTLRPEMDAARLAAVYEEAGAAAISVLTDRAFEGSLDDLRRARSATGLPVLRKDFLLDVLQVWESRAAGADAVLLIVRALPAPELARLLEAVRESGMGALVEVHDEGELEIALAAGAEVIGVNNRDLITFATRLEVSRRLIPRIPAERVAVAESGIESSEHVRAMGAAGADAVLVGRALVSRSDPAGLVRELVSQSRRPRAGKAG